jgi:capsular polysaccharide biosynthesis protein
MRFIEVNALKSAGPRVRVLWSGSPSKCEFEAPLFIIGSAAQAFADQHRTALTNPAPALYAIADAEVHGFGSVSWDDCVLGGEGWPGLPSLTAPAARLFGLSAAEYFQNAAPPGKRRRIDGVALLLARPGDQIYGHWLIDIFPIAWLALRSGMRANYILPNDTPEYALRWLRAIAKSDSSFIFYDPMSEVLLVECLLISPGLRRGNCLHDEIREYRDWFEALVGVETHDEPATNRRIFVSRRSWTSPNRHLLNRITVEDRFRQHGFELYEPQHEPLPAQISAFRQARCVVGESGSGLHNSIFCAPGAVVGVLGPAQRRPLIQSRLCKIFGQKIAYAVGEALLRDASSEFRAVAPYVIAPAIIDEFLDRLQAAL